MLPYIKCIFLVFVVLSFLEGCGSSMRYTWGNYDDCLHDYYKEPARKEEFVESLRKIVSDGEKTGKVPPGIYAEYGFVFYEQGNYPVAIQYFQKESDKWPESRVFMAKMVAIAQKNGQKKDDKTIPAANDVDAKRSNQAPEESPK